MLACMYEAGILEVIAEDDVWQHDGEPVLNGMFGVEKTGAPVDDDGGPVVPQARLIVEALPTQSLNRGTSR